MLDKLEELLYYSENDEYIKTLFDAVKNNEITYDEFKEFIELVEHANF